MFGGSEVVTEFNRMGVTHIVWIPDSHLGTWESTIAQSAIRLVRVAREGEAFALAAGLMLGGAKPVVIVQCTGFFEAGDAVRNVVHDMKLPVKMIIGVRSRRAFQQGKSNDNCATLTEPLVEAWKIPFAWVDPSETTPLQLQTTMREWWTRDSASAILWSE